MLNISEQLTGLAEYVIPAKAGIQGYQAHAVLDPGFRGDDNEGHGTTTRADSMSQFDCYPCRYPMRYHCPKSNDQPAVTFQSMLYLSLIMVMVSLS